MTELLALLLVGSFWAVGLTLTALRLLDISQTVKKVEQQVNELHTKAFIEKALSPAHFFSIFKDRKQLEIERVEVVFDVELLVWFYRLHVGGSIYKVSSKGLPRDREIPGRKLVKLVVAELRLWQIEADSEIVCVSR